jgi:hypothetical protein
MEGKAMQRKRRNDKADNKWAATTTNNTLTMTHSGRGKNTHLSQTAKTMLLGALIATPRQ